METTKVNDIAAITVSASVLAELFGVGDRRIRQLADEGILTRVSKGRYNLNESIKNYILTLKVAVDSKEQDSDLDLDDIKAQHEIVKMRMSEIKCQLMLGEVHKSSDVERVMGDMLSSFRTKLLNLPSKIAPILVMRDNADWIRQSITKEVIETLNELKDYEPKSFYSEEYVDSEEDVDE